MIIVYLLKTLSYSEKQMTDRTVESVPLVLVNRADEARYI